ncbi:hypothetical protein [Arthrobacter sp. TMN-50]
MDAFLWLLLVAGVVGAVWWFRSRTTPDSRSQVHDDAGPTSTPLALQNLDPRGRQVEE